jgi:hypothetical protein
LVTLRKAVSAVTIMVLVAGVLLAAGCGNDDDGSERVVTWSVDRPVGQKWARLAASVSWCSAEPPRLEDPIIEYEGNRVEIELRRTPEKLQEGQNGCVLSLLVIHKKITFNRDLDELLLYDSSTDPPKKRWPLERP